MTAGIIGTGSYLPEKQVSSVDLALRIGVDAEWIERKTRILSRRYAAESEATSELAAAAGQAALEQAGIGPEDVDHIIVSTSTPDSPQPPTACRVQHALGATNAAAHDLNAVRSGFVYALNTASALVRSGSADQVLVIAADLYSRSLDFTDRRTAVSLGDGAGAAVVGRVPAGYGVMKTTCAISGEMGGIIKGEAGGKRFPTSHETVGAGDHFFRMEGRHLRDFVLENIAAQLRQLVADAGVKLDQISHLIPHQPNGVLLDDLNSACDLPYATMHRTVERYGNIGSASVPVTLDDAHRAGKLADGDLVVMTAFGGGMTISHCLLRWYDPAGRSR